MKSRALAAVAMTSIALVLAGCADVVVDPERAAENKAVLSEVQDEAKNLGLTVGDIRKSCAMPFEGVPTKQSRRPISGGRS